MGQENSTLGDGEPLTSARNWISFRVNGKEYRVNSTGEQIDVNYLLVDFLRDKLSLKGTKFMCKEGGCGCCVVAVKTINLNTGGEEIRAVNSCLIPLLACDGFEITTIEGAGNRLMGYHEIQKQIVNFNATQCGYCTPGWVMSMYSLLESKGKIKMEMVENTLDGHICRCTGYRSILDALKSLTVDASEELKRKCKVFDIENLPHEQCRFVNKCSQKNMNNNYCENSSIICKELPDDFEVCANTSTALENVHLKFNMGPEWIKVTSLHALFLIIYKCNALKQTYRLIAGNTSRGLYNTAEAFSLCVDINSIAILKQNRWNANEIVLGGTTTISTAIDVLKKAAETDATNFLYVQEISKHLERVANSSVRNLGTVAGNLMLKHSHAEFSSDIFVLLEAAGAMLYIASNSNVGQQYSPADFLSIDMKGKVILSIHLLPRAKDYIFKSYKVARRYQNSHAYVSAAFIAKIDQTTLKVLEKPRFVYGGIHPQFTHATTTETFLVNKSLKEKSTLKAALELLNQEVEPLVDPANGSVGYRKVLSQSLFYKFVLGILGNACSPRFQNGAAEIEYGLSYGKQTFDVDKSQWPLRQPIPKLEAVAQSAGEIEYTTDIPSRIGELAATFILATEANATLESLDTSDALNLPGVFAVFTAKDIPPDKNNYMTTAFYPTPEEIFASSKIHFHGQAIGLVIAETKEIALTAAKLVKANYTNVQKPVLSLKESMNNAQQEGRLNDVLLHITKTPEKQGMKATKVVKGDFLMGSQYHYSMEPFSALCIPTDDGMEVHNATQFVDYDQNILSSVLGLPCNRIIMNTRKLGGSFGAKNVRESIVVAACAFAAQKLNKAVRVLLDMETAMSMIGKRQAYYVKYDVGIDEDGSIVSFNGLIMCGPGCTVNEDNSIFALHHLQSCYKANGWKITRGRTTTNVPGNTWCRAPGSPRGICFIETVMDHVAHVLNKDPIEIRMKNLLKSGDPLLVPEGQTFQGENFIEKMLTELKASADYEDRKTFNTDFNKNNRWKKRGMSFCSVRYPVSYPFFNYPVYLAVYSADGSVVVTHGGIEMGQGINTKVAQTVAHELKVPLSKVRIHQPNNVITPNVAVTANATTGEIVCYATIQACRQLLKKMDPIRAKLDNPTWEKLVMECHNAGLMLTSMYQAQPGEVKTYDIWGVSLSEVIVDILTGEYKLLRMDLIFDAGEAVSPLIDIGQIEGAIAMGIGLWTSEKLVHDENNGKLLTNRAWHYKPPSPRSIPADLRITMLRNAPNPNGVLGSKATGEPPLCLSVSVLLALRNAVASARSDAGVSDWANIDAPFTVEDVFNHSLTNSTQFDI